MDWYTLLSGSMMLLIFGAWGSCVVFEALQRRSRALEEVAVELAEAAEDAELAGAIGELADAEQERFHWLEPHPLPSDPPELGEPEWHKDRWPAESNGRLMRD